jgi:hypothetical protein
VSAEATEWLEEEYRNNQHLLKAELLKTNEYAAVKQRFRRTNLLQATILPWLPAGLAFVALLYIARKAAPEQQLGSIIAALVVAIGVGINTALGRRSQ